MNKTIRIKAIEPKPRKHYHCLKCPGYCCSYPEIEITKFDIERLARHFEVDFKTAERRYTKRDPKKKIYMLRHRKDHIFESTCMLFDQEKRCCTVYHARPGVCRKYPDSSRCGYYEFLKFERSQQDDPEFNALT